MPDTENGVTIKLQGKMKEKNRNFVQIVSLYSGATSTAIY
jgi:hypothetical protein